MADEMQHAEKNTGPDTELRLILDGQRLLTRAASRMRPQDGTLRALCTNLNCWALLLDAEDDVVVRTGNAPEPDQEVRALVAAQRTSIGKPGTDTMIGDHHVVLHGIEPLASKPSVVVIGRAKDFSIGERALIAMSVALLGLLRRDVDASRGTPHGWPRGCCWLWVARRPSRPANCWPNSWTTVQASTTACCPLWTPGSGCGSTRPRTSTGWRNCSAPR